MPNLSNETIAAISTALGEGGVGMIRLSGADSIKIFSSIFTKTEHFKPNTAYHGWIINPQTNQLTDEVMAIYFKAPKSYTGEDVVELTCHGGVFVLNQILSILLSSGARLAEKGEFTKRAFLNGKIDLSQAESVIDIIRSKSLPALIFSSNNLRGSLSQKIRSLRQKLIKILSVIEAHVDFEEDVGVINMPKLISDASDVLLELEDIISNADAGIIFRHGLKIVIIGKPNVGKSSIMNAILKYERAIVTDIPGTTRDIIDEMVDIGGIPARIIDTAGIRSVDSKPEKIGVELAEKAIGEADIVLLVLDCSQVLSTDDERLLNITKDKTRIIILNKHDLSPCVLKFSDFSGISLFTSAIMGEGINELEGAISQIAGVDKIPSSDVAVITRIRHKEAIERAQRNLKNVLETLRSGFPFDLASIDLKTAILELGEITGEEVSEEVLDKIFDEFCVGK